MSYETLLNADPCDEGRTWLLEQQRAGLTLSQAWDKCPNADWMYWALDKLNTKLTDEQNLRLQLLSLQTPLADGRIVLDLITDERSLTFIEMKRRRLAGQEIDVEAWAVVQAAAWDAARVTGWDAASSAAWAALQTAARAVIEAATRDAAWVATWAAAWAAPKAAARGAAWAAALAWQADRLREVVGNPFLVDVMPERNERT